MVNPTKLKMFGTGEKMITKRDLECEIYELELEIKKHNEAIQNLNNIKERRTQKLKEMGNQPLDVIVIGGVKYRRVVEEPKPQTLYEALHKVYYGTTYVHKDEICDAVERWLSNEVIEDGGDYNNGWNDCLNEIKKNLR